MVLKYYLRDIQLGLVVCSVLKGHKEHLFCMGMNTWAASCETHDIDMVRGHPILQRSCP